MFKKFFILINICLVSLTITGCQLKLDSMEDIDIYTTNYATEYITERLYGDHSTIYSIYPNGVDSKTYKLTKKQISDYSQSDLYIFSSLSENEKKYLKDFRKNNKNLKIIDDTLSIEYTNGIEELWLDPSNFLMMAQNIKKGFSEYISNYYLNNDINKNYEQLKIEASNLDAKLEKTVKNADKKSILVTNDILKFLTKYGLNVYSLDEDTITNKTSEDIKELLENNEFEYIFVLEDENLSKNTKELIEDFNLKKLKFKSLTNISEEDKNNNQDYFTLMNENIELLKEELYK